MEGRPLSFQWFLLLWSTGSRHAGFSSCSSGLWSTGSIVGVQGLSCPAADGILPGQGSNPPLLHWQVDSFPLSHQEASRREALSASLLLFSRSVVSDSATPWMQHARPPRPSPSPGVCSDLGLLSRQCHPTISSSVVPFSSCLQSFPAPGSFLTLCIRWPKYWCFTFSINLSNSYSGLISFRIDWF